MRNYLVRRRLVAVPLELLSPVTREKYAELGLFKPKHIPITTNLRVKPATKVEDGAVYIGQWSINGVRHGLGTQIW
jgi:hypothetical protein